MRGSIKLKFISNKTRSTVPWSCEKIKLQSHRNQNTQPFMLQIHDTCKEIKPTGYFQLTQNLEIWYGETSYSTDKGEKLFFLVKSYINSTGLYGASVPMSDSHSAGFLYINYYYSRR